MDITYAFERQMLLLFVQDYKIQKNVEHGLSIAYHITVCFLESI